MKYHLNAKVIILIGNIFLLNFFGKEEMHCKFTPQGTSTKSTEAVQRSALGLVYNEYKRDTTVESTENDTVRSIKCLKNHFPIRLFFRRQNGNINLTLIILQIPSLICHPWIIVPCLEDSTQYWKI